MIKIMSPDKAAELCGSLNARLGPPWDQDLPLPCDIAHGIGKLALERHRLWLRVIYGKQDGPGITKIWREELERLLLMAVVDMAAPERWQIDRPHFLREMVKIAMDEVESPSICKRCNGQKTTILTQNEADSKNQGQNNVIWLAGQSSDCPVCGGNGHKHRGNRYLAFKLGIGETWFRTNWRDRYNSILEVVRGCDGSAKSYLAKRLSS